MAVTRYCGSSPTRLGIPGLLLIPPSPWHGAHPTAWTWAEPGPWQLSQSSLPLWLVLAMRPISVLPNDVACGVWQNRQAFAPRNWASATLVSSLGGGPVLVGWGAALGGLGAAGLGGSGVSAGAESGALFRRNSRSASKALSASATRSRGPLPGPAP